MTSLLLLLAWLLWLLLLGYGLYRSKKSTGKGSSFVLENQCTVLVPIRNEREVLPDFVSFWKNQPQAELLFIDDHSEDDSAAWLNMKGFTCIKNEGKGKKAALRTGWKHSQRPFLVHTDADVLWTSKAWQQLHNAFAANPELRYCSLWPQIQGKWADALDFSAMGLHAQAATGLRLPFLASGAALCVARTAINDLSTALGPSQSGDDVFLLHAVVANYGPESVAVFDCPELKTHGKERWRAIWEQRLRWVSKSKHYQNHAAQYISLWIWLFHALAPITVWSTDGWRTLLGFVAAKACLDFLFFGWAKQVSLGTVALSLAYWLYLPWVPLLGWLSKASWHKAKAFADN